MKRVHVVVTGRVQGVGYRYSLWSVAERAGVTGWVRNRGYDSVEAELEGAPEAVDEILDWMLSGPPMAVSGVRGLRADGAKAQATLDAWAEFDEDAWARLQAGQRLVEDRGPDQKGAKGVGAKLLDSKIGLAFHPDVRAELERRIALLAEAKEDHEAGRIADARQKRSLVARGIYEVPTAPSARERLIVELATEPGVSPAVSDERQL